MDFLLSTLLTCSEGRYILEGIGDAGLSRVATADLVDQVIQDMPKDCTYEDYTAWSRTGTRRSR